MALGPHDVVRPDLAGWRRPRLPSPWDARPIEVVPDWIAEVVSPSNAAQERVVKRALYARHGVSFYWVVDPAARTLEALRLDEATSRWVRPAPMATGRSPTSLRSTSWTSTWVSARPGAPPRMT